MALPRENALDVNARRTAKCIATHFYELFKKNIFFNFFDRHTTTVISRDTV